MENTSITYRWADIGHWMARCNHNTDVIEINCTEFQKLSPLFQDYIWIHEHVHLLADEYDENDCNRMVDEIFISRAVNEKDLQERREFVSRSNSLMLGHSPQKLKSSRKKSVWAVLLAVILLLVIIKIKKL